MRILFFIAFTLTVTAVYAQEDQKPSPFTLSGYLETYYTFDFNKPKDNTRAPFIYSYNRHNEVNLDLGYIKGSYTTERVRANLAFMAGTYTNANLRNEPGVLKNIFEANTGVKLSSSKNLWVDAGIFASHIGFESAVGKDCWNLTRSMLADNTPYYESGVKLSYTTDNGKWFLSGMMLNGWQHIQRVDGNSLPSFGTQATFKPSSRILLNSSTFIGTDTPDSARMMRYYHNFYGIFQVSPKVGLTVGFDYGLQEKNPETHATHSLYATALIARFTLTDKVIIAVRGEYYNDPNGILIATATPHGFKTAGVSANFDYQLLPNALWRVEVRNLTSKDSVFTKEGGTTKTDTFLSTSLAISF